MGERDRRARRRDLAASLRDRPSALRAGPGPRRFRAAPVSGWATTSAGAFRNLGLLGGSEGLLVPRGRPLRDRQRQIPRHDEAHGGRDAPRHPPAAASRVPVERRRRRADQHRRGVRAPEQDDDGVTAHFADGRTARGEVLVGADGLKSVVRAQLHGESEPRYAATPRAEVLQADVEGQMRVILGKARRFAYFPVGGPWVYWSASTNEPAGQEESPDELKRAVLEEFAGWPAPVEFVNGTDDANTSRGHLRPRSAQALGRGPGHAARRRRPRDDLGPGTGSLPGDRGRAAFGQGSRRGRRRPVGDAQVLGGGTHPAHGQGRHGLAADGQALPDAEPGRPGVPPGDSDVDRIEEERTCWWITRGLALGAPSPAGLQRAYWAGYLRADHLRAVSTGGPPGGPPPWPLPPGGPPGLPPGGPALKPSGSYSSAWRRRPQAPSSTR